MPLRNDPLIFVAHDCEWTAHKDSFNLVVLCVTQEMNARISLKYFELPTQQLG